MTDQINPVHYKKTPPGIEHECITYTRAMSFDTGNAAKYAYRAGTKSSADVDLLKCHWYLTDAIENDDDECTLPSLFNTVDPDATKRSRLFYLIITGETHKAREYLEQILQFPFRLDRRS